MWWEKRGRQRVGEMNKITHTLDKSFITMYNLSLGLFLVLQFIVEIYRGDSSCPRKSLRFQGGGGRSIRRARRYKPLNFTRKQSKTTVRHRNVELNHFPRSISDAIKPRRGMSRSQGMAGRTCDSRTFNPRWHLIFASHRNLNYWLTK